jgi:hypothetical protein
MTVDDRRPDLLAIIRARCRPSWQLLAECAKPEHADVDYHPGPHDRDRRPFEVCASCIVLGECTAWALSDPDPTEGCGIAAGMSARERRRVRRRRRQEGRRGSS